MADKTYERISDNSFKSVETSTNEQIYNIDDLKANKKIYLQHVDEYQAKANAIDELLSIAGNAGAVDSIKVDEISEMKSELVDKK